MDNVIEKLFPEEKEEVSIDDIDLWLKDYEEYIDSLPPEEKAKIELKNSFESMKYKIKQDIENFIKQLGGERGINREP